MVKRHYNFPLPYQVSGVYALGLAHELGSNRPEVVQAMTRINTLNRPLFDKLKSAGMFHPITITEADLNSLPDDVWTPVAAHLGLNWSK